MVQRVHAAQGTEVVFVPVGGDVLAVEAGCGDDGGEEGREE